VISAALTVPWVADKSGQARRPAARDRNSHRSARQRPHWLLAAFGATGIRFRGRRTIAPQCRSSRSTWLRTHRARFSTFCPSVWSISGDVFRSKFARSGSSRRDESTGDRTRSIYRDYRAAHCRASRVCLLPLRVLSGPTACWRARPQAAVTPARFARCEESHGSRRLNARSLLRRARRG